MTAHRYSHGDKVYVVIEATTGFQADQTDHEIDIQFDTDLGPCEFRLPLDSAAVQIFPADEVTTEYGVRYATTSGRVMHNQQVADESAQREQTDPKLKATRQAAGIKVTPITRPVLPWTEVE